MPFVYHRPTRLSRTHEVAVGGRRVYFLAMLFQASRRFSPAPLFLLFVAALAFGAALLGSSGAEAKRRRAKAPAASAVDCKKDADCVAVVDDCCPCSEGGKQRAIPKKDRATYEKDRHKRCQGMACTEVMSQDATCAQKPFCAAGICELSEPAAAAP
jgi:hypothetical protein